MAQRRRWLVSPQFGESDTKWPNLKLRLRAAGIPGAWEQLLVRSSCGLELGLTVCEPQFSRLENGDNAAYLAERR